MNVADEIMGFERSCARTVGHFGVRIYELERARLADRNMDISPVRVIN